uniref:Hemocyanin N-terminal domain-containing protein n=1 Tax=Anopheles atroparvus TaxID=41427 RepID=A0A182J546_ANOAO
MRLTVVAIALGLVALTSAAYYPTSQPVTGVKYADKEFLYKQKFFFEVLRNIHLPLQFEEYLPYTKSYVTDESKYTNFQEVVEFFNYYKVGILGKGELFSIYNKEYMKQTYLVFTFFFNSVDFDTFYKNVVWARENVNEGIFIQALTMAVFHRPDLKGFVLPAIYEIYPNVIPMKTSGEKFFDFSVFARQKRINHKPFSYTLDVYSEAAGKGVVRVYMGPKFYDFKQLEYLKKYFVEVDQYLYDFVAGKNTIVRNSRDFYYSVRDRTTYTDLYKKIMTAYNGGEKFILDNSEAHCGFPDRLLLPKGLPSGYEMTFYFIVTPYYAPKVQQFSTYDYTYSCGVGSGSKYIDDLPFGYPLDRDIDFSYFYTKNMYFKDVLIYHSDEVKPF